MEISAVRLHPFRQIHFPHYGNISMVCLYFPQKKNQRDVFVLKAPNTLNQIHAS